MLLVFTPSSISGQPTLRTEAGAEPVNEAIIEALAARERKLSAERAEITAERADLAKARAKIEERIKRLESLIAERKAVEEAIQAAKTELVEVRTQRLVKVAEKMTPDAAARYLEGMDDPTAASIVEGMSVRKAALVLSAMKPSRAVKLSRIYLSREPRRDAGRDGNPARNP